GAVVCWSRITRTWKVWVPSAQEIDRGACSSKEIALTWIWVVAAPPLKVALESRWTTVSELPRPLSLVAIVFPLSLISWEKEGDPTQKKSCGKGLPTRLVIFVLPSSGVFQTSIPAEMV